MREIKFRAWHRKEKRWHYFDLISLIIGDAKQGGLQYENWCEFTGLRDKKGKEGFEDDRVKIPRFDGTFLIKWDELDAKYYLHNELVPRHRADIRYMVEEGEIIGNIHESPELKANPGNKEDMD